MKLHGQPSLNGKVEAPSLKNGASTLSNNQTVFPTAAVSPSLPSLFYYGSRHRLGGNSLLRWLLSLFVIVALLWGIGGLPGRWIVVSVAGLGWLGCLALFLRLRRIDFVTFSGEEWPAVTPQRLDPADKIPFFVTGYLSVENKAQRFTWLPGFYRTFATREHALICYVAAESSLGIGQWPEDEIGLWYLFFHPHEIGALQWGKLRFGQTHATAIAITYQRRIPRQGRFRPERTVSETIYLAVDRADDGKRILADLLFDENLPAAIRMLRDASDPKTTRVDH